MVSIPDKKVRLITKYAEAEKFLEQASQVERVAFDIETNQILPFGGQLAGISFAYNRGGSLDSCYIPVKHVMTECVSAEWFREHVLGFLTNQVYKNDKRVLIAHHAGFEWSWFKVLYDVDLDIDSDTMILAYVEDGTRSGDSQDSRLGLKTLGEELYGIKTIKYEDICGRGKNQRPITHFPGSVVYEYGCQDSWLAWLLDRDLYSKAEQTASEILKIELNLWKVVAKMRLNGVLLDRQVLVEAENYLLPMMLELKSKVFELMGFSSDLKYDPINLESNQELSEYLYGTMKIPAPKKGKSGYPSVSSKMLDFLAKDYPVIKVLQEYKKVHYLLNNFIQKQIEYVNPITGRIHGDMLQCGTDTGRFASTKPNLQNVAKTGEDTSFRKVARRLYVPTPGYYFIDVDYSQVELRVAASLSGEPSMLEAFKHDPPLDFHSMVYSKMKGVPVETVTKDQRRDGKTLNFGTLYGQTEMGLAAKLNISKDDAYKLQQDYYSALPTLKRCIDDTNARGIRDKQVKTFFGRVRRFPEITSFDPKVREHAVRGLFNTRIQGSSADIIKIAMVRVDRQLPEEMRIVLTVHDELLFECKESYPLSQAIEIIKNAMELKIKGFCPITVDFEFGYCWGDLTSLNEFVEVYGSRINLGTIQPVVSDVPGFMVELGGRMIKGDFKYPCLQVALQKDLDEKQIRFLLALFRSCPGDYHVYVQYENRWMVLGQRILPTAEIVDKLKRGLRDCGVVEIFDNTGCLTKN